MMLFLVPRAVLSQIERVVVYFMAVRGYDLLYFVAEMAAYVAVVWWGLTQPVPLVARLGLGVGALAVFATAWGLFAAPRAAVPLTGAAGIAFRVGWFGLAALAGAAVLATR